MLCVAFDNEASFVTINGAIQMVFDLLEPSTTN